MERVLFSAVGGHDPIASYHDGAMLHICRCYGPTKVYLYMSKEMIEREELDGRYTKSLELLNKQGDIKIDLIEVIKRPDLVKVHLFDEFYYEFDQEIRKIHKDNPDSEILLNLSSGTPAMKNALNLIATLSEYPIKAIQVATPNKRENPKEDKPEDYDLDTYWECNNDNTKRELVNSRCEELANLNLLKKIKTEIILNMINAYDYSAALDIANSSTGLFSNEFIAALSYAKARRLLDQKAMSRLEQNYISKDWLPIRAGNERNIFEYILELQAKQRRGDYADFIRGITPVVLDVFEECLSRKFKIDIKKYCVVSGKDKIYRLSNSKFEQDNDGKKYRSIIANGCGSKKIDEVAYSSFHICSLIEGLSEDYQLVDCMKTIRYVESRVRNISAHEIVSVTDEWIKKRVNMTSAEILKSLKKMVIMSGMTINNSHWDSYDVMNEKIKSIVKVENIVSTSKLDENSV